MFRGLTAFLVLINGFQIYVTKKIEPYIFFGSLIFIISVWGYWHLRMVYLNWSKKKTEQQLRSESKMAENELKEIL